MESAQITTTGQADKKTSLRVSVCVLLLLSRQHLPPSSQRPDKTYSQTGPPIPRQMAAQRVIPLLLEEERKQMSGRREGGVWAPGSRQFVNERELQTPSIPICHSKAPHFTADQTQCRLHCCYSIPPPRRLLHSDSDWGVSKKQDSSLLRVFPQSVLDSVVPR